MIRRPAMFRHIRLHKSKRTLRHTSPIKPSLYTSRDEVIRHNFCRRQRMISGSRGLPLLRPDRTKTKCIAMITSKRFIALTFSSALLFICIMLCTSSCDWFDDDDDHDHGHGPVLADKLDTPWELVFAPDGRLFATQRPGSIVTIANGNAKVWLALDSSRPGGWRVRFTGYYA